MKSLRSLVISMAVTIGSVPQNCHRIAYLNHLRKSPLKIRHSVNLGTDV